MGSALDIVLVIAVVLLGAALVVERRGRRDAERDLREAASALGVTPDSPSITRAVERLLSRLESTSHTLGRTQADLELLGDLLPIGAIRFGDDLRVDFATTTAHSLLDRQPGGLIGRTLIETFTEARVEAVVLSARDGSSAGTEYSVGGPSGPILGIRAGRSPAGPLWVVVEDLSELRKLQRIRAEFVDNISHELRTPLTIVSLLAETLAREAAAADVPAKMRDRIGKIEVEVGHLVQMVNELLELSRIESGSSLNLVDDVDVGRLAASSMERLRPFAERQHVPLQIDVAPDLPTVRADEDRLGQAFVNLVHNAVKFSPDGGEVVVRVQRVGDRIEVSVADRGIGIPRRDRARVFERFYKVDRSRVRGAGGGTGLGLSIARHIVEQHGGRIRVDSEEGRGSTFTFTIPISLPAGTRTRRPAASGDR